MLASEMLAVRVAVWRRRARNADVGRGVIIALHPDRVMRSLRRSVSVKAAFETLGKGDEQRGEAFAEYPRPCPRIVD
jgi:hypothetical protein